MKKAGLYILAAFLVVMVVVVMLLISAGRESANPVTLRFVMNSPELTEVYQDMAAAYKEATGGRVIIDLDILSNDYQAVLQGRLRAGDVPDLFMSSAYRDGSIFQEYCYDLTNETFLSALAPGALRGIERDGHLTAYPFALQSHGLIYNKKIFADAGIDALPHTLEELREVCRLLQDQGTQPFSTGFHESWVLSQTAYAAMSSAYQGDYDSLFADVRSGALQFGDLPDVALALDLLDLMGEYGGAQPLESTYEMQISQLASGEVAMISQGSWAEEAIRSANPAVELGYILIPTAGGTPVLAVEANLTFCVAKDAPHLTETLQWLDWLTTSEFGKGWISEQGGLSSPLIDAAPPDAMLAAETAVYLDAGQTCPWWIFRGSDNVERAFGQVLQSYASGAETREQTQQALTVLFQEAYGAGT